MLCCLSKIDIEQYLLNLFENVVWGAIFFNHSVLGCESVSET